jgi:hypothetical protein
MRHILTATVLTFALTAMTIATIAVVSPHSTTIERENITTNKWDNPATPSPCEADPTMQQCGELVELVDVCELDRTLMGCGDPSYK